MFFKHHRGFRIKGGSQSLILSSLKIKNGTFQWKSKIGEVCVRLLTSVSRGFPHDGYEGKSHKAG